MDFDHIAKGDKGKEEAQNEETAQEKAEAQEVLGG